MAPNTMFKIGMLLAVVTMVIYCEAKSLRFETNKGKFTNCGTVPFNISWSPEPISPSRLLELSVDYKVPHTVSGGTYNITVWFHDDPDPFLQYADAFTCQPISKYLPCPVPKGLHIRNHHILEHIPSIGSYPGDYNVRLEVKNQGNQDIICLKGRVIIKKD